MTQEVTRYQIQDRALSFQSAARIQNEGGR